MRRAVFALFLLVFISVPARAADTPPESPVTVAIGLYLLRVDSLDLKAGTANLTYYVWTRWQGDVDGTNFELMNGNVESRDQEYKLEEGGVRYAYYRVRATVKVDFDYRKFPFDQHILKLEFEHSDYGTAGVVFAIDIDGMKHLGSPEISGWTVGPPRYEVDIHKYPTNYGVPNVSPDEVLESSRFRVSFTISHEPSATFAKTFLPLFIATLIAFLAFLIPPEGGLDSRIGVGVAGIFGAATSQAVVAGNLPEIAYMTMSDRIHVLSLAFIFFIILESIFIGRVARTAPARAVRVDRVLGVLATLVYVGIVVLQISAA